MADVGGAAGSGLRSMGDAPPLGAYLRELWTRREFTASLAAGRLSGQYLETALGNLWHVLNPLLLIGVYYLVFGLLLRTDRGLGDLFLPFLSIGVFTFQFAQRTVTSCGASIANNINLIRSLQFPRAVLPISAVLRELSSYGTSVVVVLAIVLVFGQPVTWTWLLAPVVVALMTMFSAGIGLVVARLTDSVRDVANIIPFVFRLLFYVSAIIFALPAFVTQARVDELGIPVSAERVRELFTLNPFFTYPELLRDVLMDGYTAEHATSAWLVAAIVAPVTFVAGLLYFRGGEKSYGRG